ncbi:MAG: rRNA pseudouridine synthase [Treponema sp.]|nr:rRNA pseudouridine synthase [Treponema sp.]MBD5414296.1 rRNA pseudouridine synthase [Treponema sp.]
MSKERIDKILSHENFGSRKQIKAFLKEHNVLVNGERVFDTAFQVNPDTDSIIADGNPISLTKNIYLMMNKKQNTVSANKDGLHETVFDLLSEEYKTPYLLENLHIAGRLDIDTEGLLLFTTDGALIHKIISPKTHFSKKYFVKLEDAVKSARQNEIAHIFANGIHIDAEGKEPAFNAKSASLEWKSENSAHLTINEGKYHQVKRMFLQTGCHVVFLKRLSIGSLYLDESLKPGEFRPLFQKEVELLLER